MFTRWGALVYRFRRIVVILTVLLAVAGGVLSSQTAGVLSSGGWLDDGSESADVSGRIADEFGGGKSNLIAVFRSTTETDATSAGFQAAVAASLAPLVADARVTGLAGYAQTSDARFISRDGDRAYVLVLLDLTDEESVDESDALKSLLTPPPGMEVQLTGFGPLTKDSAAQSEADLQRAEVVSLPIAAIILIAVFASLIAAGMPLLVAGLSIPSALALVWVVAQQVEMSIYVLNIATMLGLALAIDYSLFIVSRFREELRNGRTVELAVERAVATAGKAVAFSGIAVAIGLSGLLFFTAPALSSIGIGGSIVVLCSVFYALTFLPAVLGMLGPRVNALSFSGLLARMGRPRNPDGLRHSRWERVAHAVMARPVAVLVPVLAVLFIAGSPLLRLQQGVPAASVFPAGLESRDAYVTLQTEFNRGETTPIVILLDVSGNATDATTIEAVTDFSAELEALDGIDRVEGPFTIRDPQTGVLLPAEQVAALYALPAGQRPAGLDALLDAYVRDGTIRLDAVSPIEPAQPEGTALVPAIREMAVPAWIQGIQVGGVAAQSHDFLESQNRSMPWAIGVTLIASAVILFLLFGSLAIPIKGVLMTLLSISASFGALVWIFQEGNLSGLLAFEPVGYTIAGNPIIMFAVIFGLSMDYEVLLLSRIQEAYRRTGDNRASVAEGLAKTAGVITGAALIMVAVFSAFALAEIITIKSIGVGMAIAVAVDATIIRVLLVPATMRLLGDWNWWAPGPLGRLADRLGFSHVEDEPDDPAPGQTDPVVSPAG